jgi:4-amino-4-deoxy-L-arabinose transferase-like glycosyltransferase
MKNTANLSIRLLEIAVIRCLFITLLLLMVWRLGLMAWLPLADTSEARYGEITRLMLSSGNWLMPHANPNEPFFAKPVLSFWLGASSAAILGANEFGFRFGHFVAMMGVGWALWLMLDKVQRTVKLFALVVLATCPLVFLSAGAVMTDAIQLTCVAWGMTAAWRLLRTDFDNLVEHSARWRCVFWVALGVGALSKGIATLALIALPLGLYGLMGGINRSILQQIAFVLGRLFPLKSASTWLGLALWLAIVLPWYILAERSYSGFLQYFLIGEHLMRFIEPGWKGDRYGNAHNEPLGTIWVYWAEAILPWLGAWLILAWRQFKPEGKFMAWRNASAQTRYLWCFILAPLLFFSAARNIIWTYALTAIPALACILALWFENKTLPKQRRLANLILVLCVVLCAPLTWLLHYKLTLKSAKGLLQTLQTIQMANTTKAPHALPLYFYQAYPFSSGFYSEYYGLSRAIKLKNATQARLILSQQPVYALIDINEPILKTLSYRELARNTKVILIETQP